MKRVRTDKKLAGAKEYKASWEELQNLARNGPCITIKPQLPKT